jgi:chromosome segregation ATPase
MKSYKAITKIIHGEKVFNEGDPVKGLDEKEIELLLASKSIIADDKVEINQEPNPLEIKIKELSSELIEKDEYCALKDAEIEELKSESNKLEEDLKVYMKELGEQIDKNKNLSEAIEELNAQLLSANNKITELGKNPDKKK